MRRPTDEAMRRAKEWLHREATVERYDGHAERLAAMIDAAERRGYERAFAEAKRAHDELTALHADMATDRERELCDAEDRAVAAEHRGYERAKRDAMEVCESFAKLAMSLRTGDEDDELNDEFHEHAAHSAKSIRADILALLDSGRDDTKGSST